MEKELIILFCVLATIVVSVFVGIIVYKHINKKINKRNKQIVIENSKLYARLLAVNDKYHFNAPLEDKLFFDKQINSTWAEFVLQKIEENIEYYIDYIDKIKCNYIMWKNYNAEYYSINNYATIREISNLKISLKAFNKIEQELLKNNKLSKPTTDFFVCTIKTVEGVSRLIRVFSQENFEKLLDEAIEQVVIKHSRLYASILYVNNKFDFDTSIHDKIMIEEKCPSKMSFDNFDWIKHIYMQINSNVIYYTDYINKTKVNKDLWEKYKIEYKSINNFATEENIRNLKIPLDVFNKIEKGLLKKKMLKPTINFTVDFNISYSSPLGRNFYSAEKTFSQEEFEQLIVEAIETKKREELEQQQREQERIERERQKELLRQQREQERQQQRAEKAKERNLIAQLERKSKQLQKREETLNKKEEEFKTATQGHIYSTAHIVENVEHTVDDTNESTWVKLKHLKQRFDNGEITYDQYEQNRKELLYRG